MERDHKIRVYLCPFVVNILPMRNLLFIALLAAVLIGCTKPAPDPGQVARENVNTHRFATLFIAQDVRDALSSPTGLENAVAFCKSNGITHVYLEAFRDNAYADRDTLIRARDRFKSDGFLVSGCVTTTQVGKPSTGWGPLAGCYTDLPTQEKLQKSFEYAAGIFDEIMIDDFYLEDCTCLACDLARTKKEVTIGEKTYPVSDDTWTNYHCTLMTYLSQDRVLGAAKKVNPKVQLIIKYPQWYDAYPERGYDVGRETALFDKIYVGTETRDWTNEAHWGGTVQYEGYFLMRWLGDIGKEKTGGGWFDWLGTTPPGYIEQARQTILAGAKESLLFCYGGINPDAKTQLPDSVPWPTPTGAADIAALRTNIPELISVAAEIQKRKPIGVPAYKPLNSPAGPEARIFDYIGMIGIPLVPCHEFPTNAQAAFFSLHAYHDPNIVNELNDLIRTGRLVFMTRNLANLLQRTVNVDAQNVIALTLPERLDYVMLQNQQTVDQIRQRVLAPLNVNFQAPDRVALYLFEPNGWVVENFNDNAVDVILNGKSMKIPARGWRYEWK